METGVVEDVLIKKIEWRIDDFFALPVDGTPSMSPIFLFEGEWWCLVVVPNGTTRYDSVGHIGLYLFRTESGPPIHLSVSFSFKTLDGKRDESRFANVDETFRAWGCRKFMARSTLLERRAQLVPSDTLTIVCTVMHDSKTPNNTGNIVLCPHCSNFFGDKYVSSHNLKCLDKPLRCQTCKDTVVLRDWFHHESDMARIKATEKLNGDLENILDSDEYSDVIVKVKDEEFRLHRNILTGRSPHFRSMFKSEMAETATGIVTIDDCEVDEINVENVCNLYEVSDKYQEDQLKEACLCFMKNKMSVESFCDFIVLALKYDDKNLLQCATDLFCKHTKEIIQSVKWQTFMSKYSTQANELYIKAFDSNCK